MLSVPSPASPAVSDLSQFSPSPSPSSASLSPSPLSTPLDETHELPHHMPPNNSTRPPYRSPRSRGCPESYVRRPRNAFIIFRCEMCKDNTIISNIETDHRRLSQIIASCWNNLSTEQRQPWVDKAVAEKDEHRRRYPGYRFSPQTRTSPARKRRTRNNGPEDKERDRRVGAAIAAGLEGPQLEEVVKHIDANLNVRNTSASNTSSSPPIFRSPLLPPIDLPSRHSDPVPAPLRQSEPSTARAPVYTLPSIHVDAPSQAPHLERLVRTAAEHGYMGAQYTSPMYATVAWDQTSIAPSMPQSTNSALGLNVPTPESCGSSVDGMAFNTPVDMTSRGPQSEMEWSPEHRARHSLFYNASVGQPAAYIPATVTDSNVGGPGPHLSAPYGSDRPSHTLYRPYDVPRPSEYTQSTNGPAFARNWAEPSQTEYVSSIRRTQAPRSDDRAAR